MIDGAAPPRTSREPLFQAARLGGAFAASNVVRMALGFVSSLLLARGLGPVEFGHWILWTAWAAALTMAFDCGLGALVTRDAARTDVDAGALVGGALVVRVTVFAPAALALWIAAAYVGPQASAVAVRLIVLIAAAGLVYGGVASAFRAWPAWVPAILMVETAGAAVTCAGAGLIALRRQDAVSMLRIALLVQVLQVAAAVTLWTVRTAGPRFCLPSPDDARRLLVRAWPFAVVGLIANGQARVAPLMLGGLSSPAELALFGVASRFTEAVKILAQSLFAGALPVFTVQVQRGDGAGVQQAFHRGLRRYVLIAATTLAILSYPLVYATYGAGYAEAWPVLVMLSLGLAPTLLNSARRVYLYAGGREADAARWSSVALLVQMIGCAVAVPRAGALGAAAALLVGEWCVRGRLRALADRDDQPALRTATSW